MLENHFWVCLMGNAPRECACEVHHVVMVPGPLAIRPHVEFIFAKKDFKKNHATKEKQTNKNYGL